MANSWAITMLTEVRWCRICRTCSRPEYRLVIGNIVDWTHQHNAKVQCSATKT
jgi:hypothetical protein